MSEAESSGTVVENPNAVGGETPRRLAGSNNEPLDPEAELGPEPLEPEADLEAEPGMVLIGSPTRPGVLVARGGILRLRDLHAQ